MKRTDPPIRLQGNSGCATQGELSSSGHQRLRVQCTDGHLQPAPKRKFCSRVWTAVQGAPFMGRTQRSRAIDRPAGQRSASFNSRLVHYPENRDNGHKQNPAPPIVSARGSLKETSVARANGMTKVREAYPTSQAKACATRPRKLKFAPRRNRLLQRSGRLSGRIHPVAERATPRQLSQPDRHPPTLETSMQPVVPQPYR